MPVDIAKLSTLSSAPLAQIRKIVTFATGEDHSKHVVEDEMDPGALSSKNMKNKEWFACQQWGLGQRSTTQLNIAFASLLCTFSLHVPCHTQWKLGSACIPLGTGPFM